MSLKGLRKKLGRKKLVVPLVTEPRLLISPHIPKPLHGVNPRTIMGQAWWDKTRKEAYRSTVYRCLACGVRKLQAKGPRWLEGHEEYDVDYLLGRAVYVRTVPLCHYCHGYIHSGRLEALADKGEVSVGTFLSIIRHGDQVLRRARIKKPKPYTGPFAEWADWRLVFNGKEYPPIHASLEEWAVAHGYEFYEQE